MGTHKVNHAPATVVSQDFDVAVLTVCLKASAGLGDCQDDRLASYSAVELITKIGRD